MSLQIGSKPVILGAPQDALKCAKIFYGSATTQAGVTADVDNPFSQDIGALYVSSVAGIFSKTTKSTPPVASDWEALAVGSIDLLDTITSATPSTTRAIYAEALISPATTMTVGSGSIAGIRGEVNLDTSKTITGGYIYGVQGKAVLKGILNNGSGFNSGLFGQIDTSASTFAHTSGYLAPLILDMGATAHLATDTLADLMVVLNTTTALINSILKTEAKAAYLFDLNDLSQGQYIVATAKGSGWDKSLKIKLNGTDYYIPCNSAAS